MVNVVNCAMTYVPYNPVTAQQQQQQLGVCWQIARDYEC